MKKVFLTHHTFDYGPGKDAGSWHWHTEDDWLIKLAEERGMAFEDALHVILTPEEWKIICSATDVMDDFGDD